MGFIDQIRALFLEMFWIIEKETETGEEAGEEVASISVTFSLQGTAIGIVHHLGHTNIPVSTTTSVGDSFWEHPEPTGTNYNQLCSGISRNVKVRRIYRWSVRWSTDRHPPKWAEILYSRF